MPTSHLHDGFHALRNLTKGWFREHTASDYLPFSLPSRMVLNLTHEPNAPSPPLPPWVPYSERPRSKLPKQPGWSQPLPPWWHPQNNETPRGHRLSCDASAPFLPRSIGYNGVRPHCLSRCDANTPARHRQHVFIGGPPGHGTTALYALIATSRHVATLCGAQYGSECEGGWLNSRGRGSRAWSDTWSATYNWTFVMGQYRTKWDKNRCVHVDKSPINMVWAPYIWDALISEGVPSSSITIVLITRSACSVPDIITDERRRASQSWMFPGLYMDANQDEMVEYLLRLTCATLSKLRERGARVILVDYQMLLREPQRAAAALSAQLPCIGEVNAAKPPYEPRDQKWFGRKGQPIAEYSAAHPQAHNDNQPTYDANVHEQMRELGYVQKRRHVDT